MSTGRFYTCDAPGCSARKGETNHWYLMSVDQYGHLVVEKWDVETAEITGVLHVCGQACAQKILHKFLEGEVKAAS